MKKAICVNVDVEDWMSAKQKIPNISDYLSQCLKGISGRTKIEQKEEQIDEQLEALNNTLQELNIKKNILELDKKLIKEEAEEQKRQDKINEQYKRWKCPLSRCNGQLNTMESDRCNSCGLPLRTDKKTEIVFIIP